MSKRLPRHQIEKALDIIGADSLWVKFGHGRFVLLRRDDDEHWRLHHTKLEVSKDKAKKQGYSEDIRSRSRSIALNGQPDGLAKLLSISRDKNGGVFWIPAGSGANLPLKREIAQSDHLGCEIDNVSRAEQLERYEWFRQVSGLDYGLQLSSGSKSIHAHIFLDEPAPIDDVVRLRRLFVLCLLGDPAVTRPHQPMRLPGFYRREKGNYQTLLSTSNARYSLPDVERGLKAAFTDLGWTFPETLSDELWADLQRALKKSETASIVTLLSRGHSWYVQQAKQRAERQREYAQKSLSGQFNLVDAIANVERQLSAEEAFNDPAHDWRFSGSNHGRGVCQWHQSSSNSAWLSQINGSWVYHCPTCTNDKPVSPFQYWLFNQHGGVGTMPTGKDWADKAKEWLGLHGVSVPAQNNFKAQIKLKTAKVPASLAISNKNTSQPNSSVTAATDTDKNTNQPNNNVISATEWKKRKAIERDTKAYAAIADMYPGCEQWEPIIQPGTEGYKARAKAFFYAQLKGPIIDMPGTPEHGFAERIIRDNSLARSLHLHDCSKATGKTLNVIIPDILEGISQDERMLVLAPSRALAIQLSIRINQAFGYDISCTHLNDYRNAKVIVSCGESVYKFKGMTFNRVLIDEVNEVSERIESGILGNAPTQSLREFERILRQAQHVVLCTADMWGVACDAIKRMGKFGRDEIELRRRIRLQTGMTILEYADMWQWLSVAAEKLAQGQRVVFPVGPQGKARFIDRLLRQRFPNKKGIVLDGKETAKSVKAKFLGSFNPADYPNMPEEGMLIAGENPDDFLEKNQPDWLIFTPILNSGVSLERDYFDAQFEYSTPSEGATQFSQRGERNRSAVGRSRKITERHVYYSKSGAPTIEAYPFSLNENYWSELLSCQKLEPINSAVAMAKKFGVAAAISRLQKEAEAHAVARPELPKFMVVKAFDALFKIERLHEEWAAYGWEVKAAEDFNQIEHDLLKSLADKIYIGIVEQRGRTLAKARTREADADVEEVENTFQAVRQMKAQIEQKLGKDFLTNKEGEYYSAWVVDPKRDRLSLSKVLRMSLANMAVNEPGTFSALRHYQSLKLLAGQCNREKGEDFYLPESPANAREVELVGIITDCPGIKDILSGKVQWWTNYCPIAIAIGKYLVANAGRIAALTIGHGVTGQGYIFSTDMSPAQLVQKVLADILGLETLTRRDTTGRQRLNWHRLMTTEERIAKAQKALEDALDNEGSLPGEQTFDFDTLEPIPPEEAKPRNKKAFRAHLTAIRAQSLEATLAATTEQMLKKIEAIGAAEAELKKAVAALKAREAGTQPQPVAETSPQNAPINFQQMIHPPPLTG